MIKRVTVVGVIVLGIVAAIGYYKLVFEPRLVREIISSSPMPTVTVMAEPAREVMVRQGIFAIGSVRATRGIDVSSEVPGLIVSAGFESGQDVDEGTPLVQLNDATEQAQLKSNLASLKSAELTFERQTQLYNTRTSPRSTLDDAIAARDQAAAAVEASRVAIEKKRITAPFSGRVGIRRVDVGQYVTAGLPFVALQTLDPIYVDFPLPEQDVGIVSDGQPVKVHVDAYPTREFDGTVEAIDSRVSRDTRTVLVRAVLKNPERKLLPGMFANVELVVGEPQKVVTVPETAITYSLYGDTVFVLKPEDAKQGAEGSVISQQQTGAPGVAQAQGAAKPEAKFKVERRIVKLGPTKDGRISVEEGLSAGELVATDGQNKLQADMVVRLGESGQLKQPETLPKG